MPKLPRISGEEVCRILETKGFSRVRQRGSHIIMQRRTENSTITVPVPNYEEARVSSRFRCSVNDPRAERSHWSDYGRAAAQLSVGAGDS